MTLNGQVIDNKNAKYPLLSYSNITYFPMTYHLSRFMGVETDWNNASKSLNITAGGAQSAYVAEPGKAPRGSVSVTLPSYKVYINSALSNDVDDTWPIFNYNGVTYFPLTFRYAYESFGWGYQWDAENGLRIDTTSAPARLPTEPNTGDTALDKRSRFSITATPQAANTAARSKAAAKRRVSTPYSTSTTAQTPSM